MKSTKEIGLKGEVFAKDYFIKCGYKVLEQNWAFKKCEVDLIVQLENIICFVEVKTRKDSFIIDPILSVSLSQQSRIINCANQYIIQHSIEEEIRFDIIGIVDNKGEFELTHLKEAFYPTID